MQGIKQPKGLYVLAMSEVWERFGFYCVQSLLVLFLVGQMGFTDKHAYALYSAFTALLYAAPVVGGFFADRFLGFRKAIIFGAILYIIGYFLLLVKSEYGFYFSLALLVCGNGYFKANVSSLLGTLYKEHDVRRDSGFTLFYLGINLGTFFGPIVGALVAKYYGYRLGFAVSGVGMLIGLIVFSWGRRYLSGRGIMPLHNEIQHTRPPSKLTHIFIYAASLAFVVLLSVCMPYARAIEIAIVVFCVAAVSYVLYSTIQFKAHERWKLIALIVLCLFAIVFWGIYMQQFTSLTLFYKTNVNRHLFGWQVPTAMLQSIQAIAIITLAPVMAKCWMKLGDSRWQPSFTLKFSYGLILQGISFIVIILAAYGVGKNAQISMWWLALAAFFRALGELCLSAIGLSAVTRLAPAKLSGMMMGIWFLAIAGGLILNNYLADFAAIPKAITNPENTLAVYTHAFWIYAVISMVAGIILWVTVPWMKRLTGEVYPIK